MRSEDQRMEFCGHICRAAQKLGIYGRFQDDGFMWLDPMAQTTFLTENLEDKKHTLERACENLIEYLKWTPQN